MESTGPGRVSGQDPLLVLHGEIRVCRKCPLHLTRRCAVPGEGPSDARIVFVGEAPGAKEDETGRPFAGRAGKVLDRLLAAGGIQRSRVFITSVLKCRPPENRAPHREETVACLPYLERQLALISPLLIVPMGRAAIEAMERLFGCRFGELREAHGRSFSIGTQWGPVRIAPVYHPAVQMHNPRMRTALEEDFALLGSLLRDVS